MALFFFIAHEKGLKFHAQPQTGAYSCYLYPPNIYIKINHLPQPPFEVRRRGWGEFAVKVKIFFKHQSQPVEVTHNLTLDTTFSGVQTPGSETVRSLPDVPF